MVMVPVRAAPVLAATLKFTAPLPLPAAPPVTVIQVGALLTAVQAQPAPAVTEMAVPVSRARGDALIRRRDAVGAGDDTGSLVTVKVWPAMVRCRRVRRRCSRRR